MLCFKLQILSLSGKLLLLFFGVCIKRQGYTAGSNIGNQPFGIYGYLQLLIKSIFQYAHYGILIYIMARAQKPLRLSVRITVIIYPAFSLSALSCAALQSDHYRAAIGAKNFISENISAVPPDFGRRIVHISGLLFLRNYIPNLFKKLV